MYPSSGFRTLTTDEIASLRMNLSLLNSQFDSTHPSIEFEGTHADTMTNGITYDTTTHDITTQSSGQSTIDDKQLTSDKQCAAEPAFPEPSSTAVDDNEDKDNMDDAAIPHQTTTTVLTKAFSRAFKPEFFSGDHVLVKFGCSSDSGQRWWPALVVCKATGYTYNSDNFPNLS